MGLGQVTIDIRADPDETLEQFRSERRERLVAPEDDMWAQLAEDATPYSLVVDGQPAGFCTVDDERQLRSFHLADEFEGIASEVFAGVLDTTDATAALPSTIDPRFLTLCLAAGGAARPVSLLYEHAAEPTSTPAEMRMAHADDHAAVVAFDHDQTESPFDFLEPYLGERIERQELILLMDDHGTIAATGECRTDTRAPGHAHLGLIVRLGERERGVGRRVMSALVHLARDRGFSPLCSTDPDNVAAQHVIRHAGFRLCHSVLRVPMRSTSS